MAEPLNTIPIQQFISSVKSADSSNQREIRMPIQQAKNLAYTLGIVMSRLEGDLEKLLSESNENEVIQVRMDGGGDWK
jgi:hypothetical protein